MTTPPDSRSLRRTEPAFRAAVEKLRAIHTSCARDPELRDLVVDGGDVKGYGYERPTPVGRIDLLAKHKQEPRWLVIELKRDQSSDQTLGQVQRYMGWVQQELAREGESVEGLIVARSLDEHLRFALKVARGWRSGGMW